MQQSVRTFDPEESVEFLLRRAQKEHEAAKVEEAVSQKETLGYQA